MKSRRKGLLVSFVVLVSFLAMGVLAAAQSRQITVWHYTRSDSMDRLAAAFQEAFPDIEVVLEHMGDFQGERFTLSQAAGTGPDVVWADGSVVISWALNGTIQPLTRYIEASGLSRSDYIPPAWDQAVWDGEVWALPLYVDANFALVYNQDMFDAAGVIPPATIAELDSIFDALTRVDADGNVLQVATIPWGVHGTGNSMYTWGWAFGGEFYDPAERRITANHPDNVRALDWMGAPARQYGFANVNALLANLPQSHEVLMTRRAAMAPHHHGIVRNWIMQHTPDLNFGLAPLPYDHTQVDRPQTWLGGFTLVMAAGAKDPDAAWEFIRYATSDPEGTGAYSAASGSFPGLLNSPAWEALATDDIARHFIQILLGAVHARPPIPNHASLFSALGQIGEAIRGERPSVQVLDEVTRMVQAELDEILAR